MNGLDSLIVTKLDVLDDFDHIRAVVGYERRGKFVDDFPSGARALDACRAVWQTFPGWKAPTGAARCWSDLPAHAREYLEWIELECGVPIESVSVGAGRESAVSRM